MNDIDDIDATAAEYVLGTLANDERGAVAERRGREPALSAAIADWEGRLDPLADTVPSVAPPDGLLEGIFSRIDGRSKTVAPVAVMAPAAPAAAMTEASPSPAVGPAGAQSAEPARAKPTAPAVPGAKVIALRNRMQTWRRRALWLGALAAALVLGLGLREWTRPGRPKSYVAVLQKDASSTAFLLSVDLDSRSFTIRPVTAQPEPGKSFELWLVDSKLGAKSLGVVGDQAVTSRANLSAFDKVTLSGATYAISVEPAGGSPTGAPTGPVVFTGQLIQTLP